MISDRKILPREGEAPAEPNVPTSQLTTTREGEAPAEPKQPHKPTHHHSGGQHQHTTRSIFRVIPRHSAAIVSHRVEIPHKTNNIRRLGRSLALPRRPPPPKDETTDNRNTNTQHAQISASFRGIPRPSFPIALKSHTKQQHPRLGRSLALPRTPRPPRIPRPPREASTATNPKQTDATHLGKANPRRVQRAPRGRDCHERNATFLRTAAGLACEYPSDPPASDAASFDDVC